LTFDDFLNWKIGTPLLPFTSVFFLRLSSVDARRTDRRRTGKTDRPVLRPIKTAAQQDCIRKLRQCDSMSVLSYHIEIHTSNLPRRVAVRFVVAVTELRYQTVELLLSICGL